MYQRIKCNISIYRNRLCVQGFKITEKILKLLSNQPVQYQVLRILPHLINMHNQRPLAMNNAASP